MKICFSTYGSILIPNLYLITLSNFELPLILCSTSITFKFLSLINFLTLSLFKL